MPRERTHHPEPRKQLSGGREGIRDNAQMRRPPISVVVKHYRPIDLPQDFFNAGAHSYRMGSFRFQRRIRILPGLRINLSKSGVSTSIGTRGAWFTIGPRGARTTVGIPGTGLSYTEHIPVANGAQRSRSPSDLPHVEPTETALGPAFEPPAPLKSARVTFSVPRVIAATIFLALLIAVSKALFR